MSKIVRCAFFGIWSGSTLYCLGLTVQMLRVNTVCLWLLGPKKIIKPVRWAQILTRSFLLFQPVQRVKSARNNNNRQVVGKRLVYKAKYPKRHYPVMHMLKVEGATCTAGSTQTHDLYLQSPRTSICSTQISPPIGSPRVFGTKRRVFFSKNTWWWLVKECELCVIFMFFKQTLSLWPNSKPFLCVWFQ